MEVQLRGQNGFSEDSTAIRSNRVTLSRTEWTAAAGAGDHCHFALICDIVRVSGGEANQITRFRSYVSHTRNFDGGLVSIFTVCSSGSSMDIGS
jgi:hypothetical protein